MREIKSFSHWDVRVAFRESVADNLIRRQVSLGQRRVVLGLDLDVPVLKFKQQQQRQRRQTTIDDKHSNIKLKSMLLDPLGGAVALGLQKRYNLRFRFELFPAVP